MEIIISDEYVETSAIISYNSVYDECGNLLFEFVADDILDTEIFVDETKSQYHIRSSLHIAASHDVTLYEEIIQDQKWEARLMLAEWDCRHGKEREDNDQEGYLIFDCFTQDEISNIMVTGYENMISVFCCKEANGTVEQLQKYVQSFESQQKESVTAIGTILNWEEGIKWREVLWI
ncbi:MAG: hypothetical protein K2M91_16445 [Lachnospiraceae bacterium]|nr:hypothetical protein [Lachnospiraceae bacterium]